jgi:3-hydroxy-D-aspartate aldolase
MSDRTGLGPNAHLIGKAGSRDALATPCLIIDLDRLEANIAAMARLSGESGLPVRPHAKTHKCVAVARRQVAAGAAGICVATLREAEVMLRAELDVHLTSPVAGAAKIELLAHLLAEGGEISAVVDNLETLRAIELAVARTRRRLNLLIDIDLGAMYRTGVAAPEQAVDLARAAAASDALNYSGVQFYSGIVQHIPSVSDRRDVYERELARLRQTLKLLDAGGLKPRALTGGGTGTFALDAEAGLLTESQVGSYVFMDVEYGQVELAVGGAPFQPALFVQATVISSNAAGLVTVDAGSKSFATDGPPPRPARGCPENSLYQSFGDEFGALLFGEISGRLAASPPGNVEYGADAYEMFHRLFGGAAPAPGLPAGAKVEFTAPHCDPTVNLHDWYHVVRGERLVDIWRVDARGSL